MNLARLVERAELLEEQLGIHIDALYVGPVLPFGKLLVVNGELTTVDSARLRQNMRLVVEVFDPSWRRLHYGFRSYDSRKFFGLELFSIGLGALQPAEIGKILLYPQSIDPKDSDSSRLFPELSD